MKSLHDLLIHELQDLHNAEMQLVEALPKMAKAAAMPELKSAFEDHLAETQTQMEQMEKLLTDLESKPGRMKCVAMAGIIKEGEEMMKEVGPESVKDAGLISAAQRVEHYEISGYGTARAFAEVLGLTEVAAALEQILEQEVATDEKLTDIATQVNKQARDESEEDEDEDEEESGGKGKSGATGASGGTSGSGGSGGSSGGTSGGGSTSGGSSKSRR